MGNSALRRCSHCKTHKALSQFSKDASRSDGLQHRCNECIKLFQKAYYSRNKQRILAAKHTYYKKNKQRIKTYTRQYQLNKLYSVTKEDWNRFFESQNGCCAICGQQESRVNYKSGNIQALSVDHDHRTGRVRGLLCHRCNRLLGFMNDDPALLEKMVVYLRLHIPEPL